MNHIILIGNGFDLAHGLETSYKDFLNWYLKKITLSIEEKQFYEDDIFKISFDKKQELNSGFYLSIPSPIFKNGQLSNHPESIFSVLETYKYNIQKKSLFAIELFKSLLDRKWVDIENLYYECLVDIYRKIIVPDSSTTLKDKLIKSNNSFFEITRQLEYYLNTINIKKQVNIKPDILDHFKTIIKSLSKSGLDELFIINFNYTSTINLYIEELGLPSNINLNHIHGNLIDKTNPIIFGYGDETDSNYEEIERLNDNEFLKFMKSFGYAKTNNYQDVIHFITSNDYTVHIMGHSCGLSDRVLLKRIFENELCKIIQIYYHQKNEFEDDFITKYMDISRHFSIDKKEKMREKIATKNKSIPLLPFDK